MTRDLLLGHAQSAIARCMQQDELDQPLFVIAGMDLLQLRHQPIDQRRERLHCQALNHRLGLE